MNDYSRRIQFLTPFVFSLSPLSVFIGEFYFFYGFVWDNSSYLTLLLIE